jgi:hypothetical protein
MSGNEENNRVSVEEGGSASEEDESSSSSSISDVKIESLDEMKKVLSNLKSKVDDTDPFEDYITREDNDDNIYFDIRVPADDGTGESVKNVFFDLFIELADVIADIPRVISIDFLLRRPEVLHQELRFNGQYYGRSAQGTAIQRDKWVTLVWHCDLPLENVDLLRIQSILKSMQHLDIQNKLMNPHIQLFPSFESKATSMNMSGPFEWTPKHFPCLEVMNVNDSNERFPLDTDAGFVPKLKQLPLLNHFTLNASLNSSRPLSLSMASGIASLPVSHLGLSNFRISKNVMSSLISGIKGNTSLESFSFEGSRFFAESFELLCKGVSVLLRRMRRVDLKRIILSEPLTRADGEKFGNMVVDTIKSSKTLIDFEFRPAYLDVTTEATAAAQKVAGSDALKTWRGSGGSTIDHTLKLNKAGRRLITEMVFVPEGLIPQILSNANNAYDATGIFYLMREHTDLRSKVITALAKKETHTDAYNKKQEARKKRQRRKQ